MSSDKESWDIAEFQYQCYNTDFCTFPEQFCSSDSKRCQECKFKCDTTNDKFPLACRTFCDILVNDANAETEDGMSWINQPFWFYTAVGFVLIIALLVVVSIRCRRNIADYLGARISRRGRITDPKSDEAEPLKQGFGDGEESGVESMSSKDDIGSDRKGPGLRRKFPEVLKNINPTRRKVPSQAELVTSHSKATEHIKDPQSSVNASVSARSVDPSPQLVTSVSLPVRPVGAACSLTVDQRVDQGNAPTTSGETTMTTNPKYITMTTFTQTSNQVTKLPSR